MTVQCREVSDLKSAADSEFYVTHIVHVNNFTKDIHIHTLFNPCFKISSQVLKAKKENSIYKLVNFIISEFC